MESTNHIREHCVKILGDIVKEKIALEDNRIMYSFRETKWLIDTLDKKFMETLHICKPFIHSKD